MNFYSKRTLLAAALIACIHPIAQAAEDPAKYPSKAVRWIVPFPPGGGNDTIARLIGQQLATALGQQVLIDNRPGAAGALGAQVAASAPADGYTMFLAGVGSHGLNPNLRRKLPYDAVKDFEPISLIASAPLLVVVHPSLPVKSVKDLIALAKARPGVINYASNGTGGSSHMAVELFDMLAGTRMTHVPYKGVADGYPAVISGQVNWMLGSPISAQPLIKAGRLRGIAVTTEKRLKAMPELPTIAETVPGYEVSAWFGLFGPAKLPAHLVEQLYREASRAVNEPATAAKMEAGGTEVVGNPPREFTQQVKAEYGKWLGLVKKTGLRLQ